MQIQTIKFKKNKETGALYGMCVGENDNLITEPENTWKRLQTPGYEWRPFVSENLIVVDFPDEVFMYIKIK